MPSHLANPELGRAHVPDHRLNRVIGRGAYGEVWLAHTALGTPRAVKIVHRHRFEHARPFEREFRGISECEPLSRQHPALVDILQVGRDPDGAWFYYVMELADGAEETRNTECGPRKEDVAEDPASADCGAEQHFPRSPFRAPRSNYLPRTLRGELAARGRLPVAEAAALGAKLADGLAFLHQHGLVHRDLKPANILYVNGEPKLGDIGLVAPIGDGSERSFVGTEGYIAPEGPGTPGADLFALGLMLYEAATGLSRHDFPQVPPALAASSEAEDFAELNAVLLRACEAQPARRYASAAAMRDELQALGDGRSVRRLRELEARLQRLRVLGGAFAAIGLLAAGGGWWQHRRAAEARAEATREAQHVAVLAGKERELRLHLYAADMREAGEAARAGNLGRARELLTAWDRHAAGEEDVRDVVWHFLAEAARGDRHRVFTGHTRNVSGLALAPERAGTPGGAQTLYSCGFDGTVRVWDTATGKGRVVAEKPGESFYEIEALSDGSALLLGGSSAVWRWEIASGAWTRLTAGAARHVAATRDGAWFAFGGKTQFFGPDEPVEIVPLTADAPRRTFAERSGRVAVSPDGALLATGDVEGICAIYRTGTWERAHALPSPGQIVALTFSADARHLAAALREGGVALWDTRSGELLFHHQAHGRQVVWCAAFSADGQWLATGGSDQSVHLWDVAARRLDRVLRGHEDEVWSVLFPPDGTWLASSGKDETVRLWPLTTPDAALLPERLAGRAIFSPDGRWLACAEKDAPLRVFDAATFAPVAALPRDEVPLAFAPAGDTLLSTPRGRTLTRWRWRTGEAIGTVALADVGAPGDRIALSPDGCWLAMVLADGALAVWSADTGALVARERAGLHELAFSPDSRWLATSHNDFSIRLRATSDWTVRATIAAHKMRTAGLAFSPDSHLLASASWDGTAALWEVPGGARQHTFRGHTTSLQDAVFLPGGRLLALLEGDASISFWDLRSQRASARLPTAQAESNHNLAAAPHGRALLSTRLTGARPGVWRAAKNSR